MIIKDETAAFHPGRSSIARSLDFLLRLANCALLSEPGAGLERETRGGARLRHARIRVRE